MAHVSPLAQVPPAATQLAPSLHWGAVHAAGVHAAAERTASAEHVFGPESVYPGSHVGEHLLPANSAAYLFLCVYTGQPIFCPPKE